ncbi:phage integrase family protein [Noviherbaspirillum suwonense]|uniref:Site-specific recombinase XerD n=1 Tax=Noviherbaspirillum suwonense TaxID=1224511 RepID=A0ABY1QT95_9BURK|nr:phage integrase family protein [Noviherbaspirillum suwonense]SMP80303.1 Site-specific recombinase XerD [Noviherbaspirillum suwonense]
MAAAWIERGTVLIQLGRHHFAFYRGYLDGLDVRTLARCYLETTPDDSNAEMDLRVAKSMVWWIRDQLSVTARRTGNTSAPKLLRVSPEALRITYAPSTPSLEEFREERDPYEMFTENELIELFHGEYGNTDKRAQRRTQRNDRLRRKQLEMLKRLEELTDADPHLCDGVEGWLDPVISDRLMAAGIQTLGQLVTTINRYGFRWYNKVPRVGIKAAKQIVDWLMLPETAESLGEQLSARGIMPRKEMTAAMLVPTALRTGIVPMENLFVPHDLSGAFGSNRGDRPALSARNDLEAIQTWLARLKPGGHSHRSYRKEAERFLLWAIVEVGKPISSLTVEDCISYRNFLWYIGRETPEFWSQYFRIPQDRWLGQRSIDRFSSHWRPFEGPLSASSQKTALVILQGLMQWLTEQNYLHVNPFKAMPHLAERATNGVDASRALTVAEWKLVKKYLGEMEHDQRYYRLRFVLALAYSSGCRLSELASLRREHLKPFTRAGETTTQWELHVVGKGEKTRFVQLNPHVVAEIRDYFRLRGYETFAAAPEKEPLIASFKLPDNPPAAPSPAFQAASDLSDDERRPKSMRLTSSRLYKVLKSFFAEVADSVASAEPETAHKLRRASTHWLRHTFATHGIHNGMALETIRDLLGHASLTTTSIYVTTEKDKRSREVEKLGDLAAF